MTSNQAIHRSNHALRAPALRWFWTFVLILTLASCSDQPKQDIPAPETVSVVGRILTPELWAGMAAPELKPLPTVDIQTDDGLSTIRGPIETRHPVDDRPIQVYERIERLQPGHKRQLIAVTQNRTALGRVLEQRSGLPDRRFTGDVVFPLGVWAEGESREFVATEFTIIGPALRLATLEILEIDHAYKGVAHSLSYRLSIRDEAGRLLECEVAVYSPGRGLVNFKASNYWASDTGCATCSCPG